MAKGSLSRIGSYSKAVLINCRRVRIVILVLCGLGTLMGAFHYINFDTYVSERGYWAESAYSAFLEMSSHFFTAAALAGFLLIAPIFKELYNRQFADVEFSLPLSSSERYKAKLTAVVKCHLLPFVIGQAMLMLAGLIFGGTEGIGQAAGMAVSGLTTLMFTDASAMFCVCCCGSLIECVYTPVVFAVSLTLLPAQMIQKLLNTMSGRESDLLDPYDLPIGYTQLTSMLGDEYNSNGFVFDAHSIINALISIAISICLIFLSYRLYKKRDGMQTGTPFVYGWAFWVISYLALGTILFYGYMNAFYFGIIGGAAVFLGIAISSKRGAPDSKYIINALAGFTGCVVAVVVIGYAAYMTGGFGYVGAKTASGFDDKNTKWDIRVNAGNGDYFYEFQISQEEFDKSKLDAAIKECVKYRESKGDGFINSVSEYLSIINYEENNYSPSSGDVYIYCHNDKLLQGRGASDRISYHIGREDCCKISDWAKAQGLTVHFWEYLDDGRILKDGAEVEPKEIYSFYEDTYGENYYEEW